MLLSRYANSARFAAGRAESDKQRNDQIKFHKILSDLMGHPVQVWDYILLALIWIVRSTTVHVDADLMLPNKQMPN